MQKCRRAAVPQYSEYWSMALIKKTPIAATLSGSYSAASVRS
jgi:hypothetical protein